MTQSERHRGPISPRLIRGLACGLLLAGLTTGMTGCGVSYVFRHISPLHPTGWSFAWPILPSQSQRLEEDMAREERDRVPILDPIPGEFAPGTCLDPPSEEEAYAKVPKFRNGSAPFYEVHRDNVNILIEKIGDSLDGCKVYPLAGPCQLVHCHYKCTVYFDETYTADYPIPYHHVAHRVEVVYIDKDHLRRCGGPANASTPPAEGRDAPGSPEGLNY